MPNIKTHVGGKKGSEQYWHCVEQGYICNHAISGGLWRKHSVQYGGVVRSMLSAIVLAQKHVNISGGKEKKKTTKVKYYSGRRENLEWTSAKPKLRFPALVLLSRKKTDELKDRKSMCWFSLDCYFCKCTNKQTLFYYLYKSTVFLLTVYKDMLINFTCVQNKAIYQVYTWN